MEHYLLNRPLSMIKQTDQSHCDRSGLEETVELFVTFYEGCGKVRHCVWRS